ncbi:MAG TPA: VWA domain-containing protein [Candidatus Binataceae bacterium]|nr:VWA domain-containing protein [Candidatus Binataceae bacterium]
MARKSKIIKPKRLYVPTVPVESSWLESDSYDRRAWSDILLEAGTLADLQESGERLVPHFAALMQDLFFALFKYNVVWRKPDAMRASAALNRKILEGLLPTAAFEALKDRTLLEEDKAAIAAMVLGEEVLEMVRAERLINRREMLDLWDLQHQEQDLEERASALKAADEAPAAEPSEANDAKLQKKLEELKKAAERAAQVSEARLNQKSRAFDSTLAQLKSAELKRLQVASAKLVDEVDRAAQDSHDFGLEFGQAGRLSAGERIELGRRLARNKKIAELARLVGRFKQDARALRRKTVERGEAEVYDIERGSELGRLIPAELLALHHPGLYRDFKRRLLEGAVLQYQLRQDEQKGKGPMITCLDVSSSMEGEKELWAKAVTLTLMDIARRQRRLFRAVLFSSGEGSLRIFDLNRERRYQPELAKVMELAEYFPGGGTDFEAPLDAAVALLEQKQLKRADIVMITDGESRVRPEWLKHLQERKEELQFSIYSVLIDLGSSELSTLAQLSDRVTSIKKLSAEGTREIFLTI